MTFSAKLVIKVLSASIATVLSLTSLAESQEVSSREHYTGAMFHHDLDNTSTAPDFVLIRVTDTRTGSTREVCTEAPFLEGALHMEFGIPYDDAGEKKVRKLVLGQPDRHFQFSKPKALVNIPQYYTPQILDAVRKLVAPKSDDELIKTDFVQGLYIKKLREEYSACRDAVAHALLERGISCTRGCRVGNLTPYK
jgi:hypothetical protein